MTIVRLALDQWRRFATGSVNHRIFSAMIVIATATLAVKATAMAKDMVVAGHFGVGDALDAFLIAVAVPAFAVTVIGQSFSGAFLPEFVRLREQEGPAAAKRLFANIMVLNFALLVACAVVLGVAGKPILDLVASEFSPEKRALAYQLFLILLPLVILEGQVILWGSVLHAGEKFALTAFAPILTPLTIVLALLVTAEDAPITAVAVATVVGCAAELAVLGFALARRGLLPAPRWAPDLAARRHVIGQYIPLVLGAMTMNGSTIIDQIMASWLGSGSVAALTYANKIPSVVAGVGVTALGTALLPHFSQLVARNDYDAIRHTLRTYIRGVVIVAVPITAVLLATSDWVVMIIFERGAFTESDTRLVSDVQRMYLLQIPFFVLGIVGVRLLVAMSKNHLVTIMAVVNLIVNIVGNLVFMRWFGVSGIALATSVVYMISMSMILWLVHVNLSGLQRARLAMP